MEVRTDVPLAPFTTFHIGGPARYFLEVTSEEELLEGIAYARKHALSLFILGAGSNILVNNDGFNGVVLHMRMQSVRIEEANGQNILIADAGARWDDAVDAACVRGLFGIENLAGIPGTVGGALVQNIGAYGAELSSTFLYADIIDAKTGSARRITREEASFAYRTSVCKTHPELVIVRVALALSRDGAPDVRYADLARAVEQGVALRTPSDVARAVRDIRSRKFPSAGEGGTAGSFFKNPIIEAGRAAALVERFPELPHYPQDDGRVKVSLAWLLDHALSLKGYAQGPVRLYEKQPLVIVANAGARASDVDALANEIALRVHDAFGIDLEREVETIGA